MIPDVTVETISRKIKSVADDLLILSRMLAQMTDDKTATMDDVYPIILEMNDLKSDMAIVYDTATFLISTKMGTIPEYITPNGIKIEKRAGSDRKTWDHIGIAKNVASRLGDMAIDMQTGEVIMSPQDMVVKLLDYCNPSYWRVKELSKIGINADRYCEVSEAKTSIIVRRVK